MNQTKTTTSQEQFTKNLDLVMKERALNELMSINEAINKYEASKEKPQMVIRPASEATMLLALESKLPKGIDYQQLPYRHTHNCIFPNGEQEVNRVWHSCL